MITLAAVGLLGVDTPVTAAVILDPGALVDTAVQGFVRSVRTIGLLVANLAVGDALLALEHAPALELSVGAGGVLA